MNFSFWERQNIEFLTDITIIGAGIVGLSTAISLKQMNPNYSIKIIERGANPHGASTKNAGFACFGSISELVDDINHNGIEQCRQMIKMRWQGLEILKKRVPANVMNYQGCGGMEYFKNPDTAIATRCIDNMGLYNDLIADTIGLVDCYSVVTQDQFSGFERQAIFNQYEGVLNPVAMIRHLTLTAINLGVNFHFGVDITAINRSEKVMYYDDHNKIHYHKLIVCTNGFASKLLPTMDVKPARNQVLITKPQPQVQLPSAYHVDQGYLYFRQIDGRILLGGGRNMDLNGELTDQFGHSAVIQNHLMDFLENLLHIPRSQVDYWWSGILGISGSKFPIVQFIDDDTLVGVRMGGMGVAIGSYIGEQLASEITKNFHA